jgi:hypothetical protein
VFCVRSVCGVLKGWKATDAFQDRYCKNILSTQGLQLGRDSRRRKILRLFEGQAAGHRGTCERFCECK